jgi:amino-acid N-acetyltransferase
VRPLLRPARPEDASAIRALIQSESLPVIEVEEWLETFWVIEHEGEVAACAGIERYGESAVLRSVVVGASLRGTGEGERLTQHALEWAREDGAVRCYLFTLSAAPFFERFGFRRCTLDDFNPAARAAWQWRGVSENEQLREILIPMQAVL